MDVKWHAEKGRRLSKAALYEASVEVFYRRSVRDLRGLSMLPGGRLRSLVKDVDLVMSRGVEGAFVECGVWRGGASFLAARRFGPGRPVWMFDSFEGLPAPTDRDGDRAPTFATSPDSYDNCTADVAQVEADASRLRLDGQVRIVKGWFDDSLPRCRDEIGKIALLRIDGDWYQSVMTCLETLFDSVASGGIVVIDDYYDWPGASRAVHDFLSKRESTATLRTSDAGPHPCARIDVP